MKTYWIIALTLISCGCVSLTPEQQDQLERDAAREIICVMGDDCDVKWGRAIAWVSRNSHWKIQTQTDNLIQTFTPVGSSAASGFLVNKVPLGNGQYQIVMSSACDN